MIGSVLEFDDLKRISGYSRLSDVERWAKDIGLPVKRNRGGLWTTVEAVNSTLGVRPAANDDAKPYAPDIL